MIDEIVKFLKTCDLFRKYGGKNFVKILVDTIGTETVQYSIEVNPVQPIVKRFIGGTCWQQINFDITSIEEFSPNDDGVNASNNEFYEKFAEWVYEQNMNGLPQGWIELEVVGNGYRYSDMETSDKASYRITLNLIYEGGKNGTIN